jgi:hypothetical protein
MITLPVLKSLALGVWLGALVMLGVAVAGPIFRQSPSRTIAGEINGTILARMNSIEWVCLAVAAICTVAMLAMDWKSGPRTQRIVETVMIVIMAGVLWYYSSSITNRMTELRGVIKDFDTPRETTEYVEARAEFDGLHKSYTRMVGINMLLILGSFVVTVMSVKHQK